MPLIPITHALLATSPVAGSAFLRALCEANLANYPAAGPVSPWMAYLAEEAGSLVGACAFKAPPDDDGVEIAYFTFPENEGQGVATRMAAALIAIAAEHGVPVVRASSQPDNHASGRVLDKLGFERAGNLMHPEAGELWVWRRAAARTAAGEHP
ncbi:GNAT family N-acetyltransferase [Azoarcus sp. DD4]|uniref:GNAT family N-acetyltransferase n=1 Tax=Azoarcus sp. DD4 TaxID=2027405 RepID=UPI00143CC237|nr:GNAT family protein [Azoarcus sp. DD4]